MAKAWLKAADKVKVENLNNHIACYAGITNYPPTGEWKASALSLLEAKIEEIALDLLGVEKLKRS